MIEVQQKEVPGTQMVGRSNDTLGAGETSSRRSNAAIDIPLPFNPMVQADSPTGGER